MHTMKQIWLPLVLFYKRKLTKLSVEEIKILINGKKKQNNSSLRDFL